MPMQSQGKLTDFIKFRPALCRHSLSLTVDALLHPDAVHWSCLEAAREQIYTPYTKLRRSLKQYPKTLQILFLELMNRTLDQGRYFTEYVYDVQDLRAIVIDYFQSPFSLSKWQKDKPTRMAALAAHKTKTPTEKHYAFIPFKKLVLQNCHMQGNPDQGALHPKLQQLRAKFSMIYTKSLNHDFGILVKMVQDFQPQRRNELKSLKIEFEKVSLDLWALYKAIYFPPLSSDPIHVIHLINNMDRHIAFVKRLNTMTDAVYNACLTKKYPQKSCASLKERFKNLDLMVDIIDHMVHKMQLKCNYPVIHHS